MTELTKRTAILPFDAEHPVFAGHFPGAPIVPGVLLIDWALAAIQAAESIDLLVGELPVVKFLQPVGQSADLLLSYVIAETAGGAPLKITFRIECGAQLVASGSATAQRMSADLDR